MNVFTVTYGETLDDRVFNKDGIDKLGAPHVPIKINDDTEFISQAIANGWSGSGTNSDPYIINNYTIDALGYSYGIFIANTTFNFIVNDTEIFNASLKNWDYDVGASIALFNCTNGTVMKNNLHHSSIGIYTEDTFNMTLRGNYIESCSYGVYSATNSNESKIKGNVMLICTNGVYLSYTSNSQISGNYLVGSANDAVGSVGSINNIISNNTIESNSRGIYFFNSNNNDITKNKINGTIDQGMMITDSDNNEISYNRISYSLEEGIYLNKIWNQGSTYNTIHHNSLYYNNGSSDSYDPMGVQAQDRGAYNRWNDSSGEGNYWFEWAYNNNTNDMNNDGIVDWPYPINRTTDVEDQYPLAYPTTVTRGAIRINNNSDFTWNNGVVTGDGTASDPYLIEGWEIDAFYNNDCIYVGNTTKNFIIRNCQLEHAYKDNEPYFVGAGISFYNTTNGEVSNLSFRENYIGVNLNNTVNSNLREMEIYDGISGFSSGVNLRYDSDLNTLENIMIRDCYNGLYMGEKTNGVSLKKVRAINNTDKGILLNDVQDIDISDSIARKNTDGIQMENSQNIKILKSISRENSDTGITISRSNFTRVMDSEFLLNDLGNGDGIFIDTSDNIKLDNNSCKENINGIKLQDTDESVISDNICNHNSYGIYISSSENNTINGNDNNENKKSGLRIDGSNYNKVENNFCDFNRNGTVITFSDHIEMRNNSFSDNKNISSNSTNGIVSYFNDHMDVINNTCDRNGYGIILARSRSSNISDNTLSRNTELGMLLSEVNDSFVFNNSLEEGWAGMILDHGNRNRLDGNILKGFFGGIISQGCDGNILNFNNISSCQVGIILENDNNSKINFNLIGNCRLGGVILQNDSRYYKVKNNLILQGDTGLAAFDSRYGIIINNTIRGASAGIMLENTTYNDVYNNSMWRCGIVINGNESCFTEQKISVNNTVNNRPVYYYKNIDGGSSSVPLNAAEVIFGNVTNIKIENLNLSDGSVGVDMGYSKNIIIRNNTVSRNWYGIYLKNSTSSVISNNTFTRNNNYSLFLNDSFDNLIYHNLFIYNNGAGDTHDPSHVQARDDGNNTWNLSSPNEGNYWSDWTSPDNDSNGIVDNPYDIFGGNDRDYYPLVNPLGFIIISTPPKYLTADVGYQYVNLTWEEPAYNGSSDIIEYRIYRATNIRDMDHLDTVPYPISYYNDTDVTNGIQYYYNVTAVNKKGESNPNSTTAIPGSAPFPPVNLAASSGEGYVNITGDPSPDDGGFNITEYRVYRGTSSGSEAYLDSFPPGQSYYNDTTVSNEVTYYYYITAFNSRGESVSSEEVSATPLFNPTDPTPPRNLAANESDGYVNLSWDEPSDDGNRPITEYLIFRGTLTGSGSYYGSVTGTQRYFNDTSVTNGQTYYYHLTAMNEAGKESGDSNEIKATPRGISNPPRNVGAEDGDLYIDLTWDEPSDDGGSAVIEYIIYRASDVSEPKEKIATLPGDERTYRDTDVDYGVTYYYNISAVNGVGESDYSEEVSAIPVTVPEAPENLEATPGDKQVMLNWDEPQENGGLEITEYRIYRGGSPENLVYIDYVSGSTREYLDKDVSNDVTYYYKVSAKNSKGEGERSGDVVVTPISSGEPPEAPKGLVITSGDNYIEISWDKADDPVRIITGYNIYRNTSSGSELYLDSVSGSTYAYNDTDVENDVEYFYYVTAVNDIGESEPSEKVSAAPEARIIDTDGDGDPDETDPDDDDDGMPDVWEIEHGLDPRDKKDAGSDKDNDGLTNLEEYQAETDPENSDTDGDGISDGDDEYPLEKKEDEESFPIWLIAVIAAAGGVGALGGGYYFFAMGEKNNGAVIEDVFVISNNALLIAHNTRRLKPDMDDDILAGMLTAVQNFIKDSFKDEGEWALKKLEFADSTILVERGKYVYMAIIYSGELSDENLEKINKTIENVEDKYEDALSDWSGDMEEVRGIKDDLRKIF